MTPDELVAWRRRNGYSQAKMAETLGIHLMTVSKWERGKYKIPPFLRLALERLECQQGGEQGPRDANNKKEEQ